MSVVPPLKEVRELSIRKGRPRADPENPTKPQDNGGSGQSGAGVGSEDVIERQKARAQERCGNC